MNGDKWIGITDKAKEGQYLTVHGDNMPWAKWSFGEPNGCCGGIQAVQFWFEFRHIVYIKKFWKKFELRNFLHTIFSLGADCVRTYANGYWDDASCQYSFWSVCEGPAVCGNCIGFSANLICLIGTSFKRCI